MARSSFLTPREYINEPCDKNEKTKRSNYLKRNAWNNVKGPLLEIVCLLSTLCKVDQIHYPDDFDPFDRVFCVPIVDAFAAARLL